MVTFITLFLGLITGPHPVQLAVDGPVARVELWLDEEMVAVADGPPWRVSCDFGSCMVPLFVWSAGGRLPLAWGPSEDVSTPRSLTAASKRLLKQLDRQWIVWVEGSHMINRIELDPTVSGIRLAGVP